jgi:hypothetical protein
LNATLSDISSEELKIDDDEQLAELRKECNEKIGEMFSKVSKNLKRRKRKRIERKQIENESSSDESISEKSKESFSISRSISDISDDEEIKNGFTMSKTDKPFFVYSFKPVEYQPESKNNSS